MTEADPKDYRETDEATTNPIYAEALNLPYLFDEHMIRKPIAVDVPRMFDQLAEEGFELGIESQIRSASITIEGTSTVNPMPKILFHLDVYPLEGELDKAPSETVAYRNGGAISTGERPIGNFVEYLDRKLTLTLLSDGKAEVRFLPGNYTYLPSLQKSREALSRDADLRSTVIRTMLASVETISS